MHREQRPDFSGNHSEGADLPPSLEEQQEQVRQIMQTIREERQNAGKPIPPDVSLMAEAHRRIAGIKPGDDLGIDRAAGDVPINRPNLPKLSGPGL